MQLSIVIRCDGSATLGSGHVFRMLVLASELRDIGANVIFVCRNYKKAQYNRILDANFNLFLLDECISNFLDTKETMCIAYKFSAQWIIIDRYDSTEDDLHNFKAHGFKVLVVDDLCDKYLPVDIILNQNINGKELKYKTLKETVHLVGTEYTLINRIYKNNKPETISNIDSTENVMVFMGGSDFVNSTTKVMSAINLINNKLNVSIVLGKSFSHDKSLGKTLRKSHHYVNIYKDLESLCELMKINDVAISAGGSVIWEFCCMGIPFLSLPIANNQTAVSLKMQEMNCAIHLGLASELSIKSLFENIQRYIQDIELLNYVKRNCWNLVDGYGAQRVANCIYYSK